MALTRPSSLQITHIRPGTSARNVSLQLTDLPVSIMEYGAAGDGVTADDDAIEAALSLSNAIIDGSGRTYRLTRELLPTGENVVIRNAKFDLSDVAISNSRVIRFAGSEGTQRALTANAAAGVSTVTVADTTGFTAGGYAFIRSSAVWSLQDSKTWFAGQMARIQSVGSGTQLTLASPLLYAMNTADSAWIAPLTVRRNITFDGCEFFGANVTPYLALSFERCVGVQVRGCRFNRADYAGVALEYVADAQVDGCRFEDATGSGSSYGVMIANASTGISVTNCIGRNLRHMVTIGGQRGVCTFIDVSGNKCYQMRDAGIDAHSAADHVTFRGNHIEMGSGVSSDGIINQGASCVISDNTIVGGVQKGVYWQNRVRPGMTTASGVLSNNAITMRTGGGMGIAAFTTEGCVIDGLVISGNVIAGPVAFHVQVYAAEAPIRHVAITGNMCTNTATTTSCYVQNEKSNDIIGLSVTGNYFRCTAGVGAALGVDGNSATETARIYNATVTGNTLAGGLYGLDADYCTDITESGNSYIDNTTRLRVRRSLRYRTDQAQLDDVTVTASTHTVDNATGRIVNNGTGTLTLTMPDAPTFIGRRLSVRNAQAQAVNSDASNVVPVDGTTAGTAILPATDGAWAILESNGTAWTVTARGT